MRYGRWVFTFAIYRRPVVSENRRCILETRAQRLPFKYDSSKNKHNYDTQDCWPHRGRRGNRGLRGRLSPPPELCRLNFRSMDERNKDAPNHPLQLPLKPTAHYITAILPPPIPVARGSGERVAGVSVATPRQTLVENPAPKRLSDFRFRFPTLLIRREKARFRFGGLAAIPKIC